MGDNGLIDSNPACVFFDSHNVKRAKNCDTNHTPRANAYGMLLPRTSPMPGQQNCPGKRLPVLA